MVRTPHRRFWLIDDEQREATPDNRRPPPRESPVTNAGLEREVLALQRGVGNRAFGGLLARRSSSSSATVELRKPPPWRKADPASPRATPENRQLAAEIDTLDALGDDVLVYPALAGNLQAPFAGGDERGAGRQRTLQALEYVLDQRARQARYQGDKARQARDGLVTPDWQQWRYVSGDAEKRAAWVRWLLEQRVRETGSFEGGARRDGDDLRRRGRGRRAAPRGRPLR